MSNQPAQTDSSLPPPQLDQKNPLAGIDPSKIPWWSYIIVIFLQTGVIGGTQVFGVSSEEFSSLKHQLELHEKFELDRLGRIEESQKRIDSKLEILTDRYAELRIAIVQRGDP